MAKTLRFLASPMARHGLVAITMSTGLFMPASVAHAQTPHVIRGTARTDAGSAIAGADVIVTVSPSAETFSVTTDSSGSFRVTIERPTGEYLLYVSAIGRRPLRQRVAIVAPETVATVNVRLAAAVTAVAAVRVQERRPRPTRALGSDGATAGTEAGDKTADGVTASVPPDLQSTIEGLASMIPGLSVTGAGISAFGLGGDANMTSLNGLAFAGSDMPRDARTTTRFRTSSWDPTIGGFAGVQASISLAPGSNIATRRSHVTVDAPSLQVAGPAGDRLGQRYANLAFDEGGAGPYALDRLYYNFGIHVTRQTASIAPFSNLDRDALTHASISPDSATRVAALLNQLGVPAAAAHGHSARTTTTISFIERIDRAPPPTPANAPPGSTLALTGFGRLSRSNALSLTPATTASYAGRTTSGLVGLQGLYSRFFGANGDYVNETTSGLSVSASNGDPYVRAPTAAVTVLSSDGVGTVLAGGNGLLENDATTWSWETVNQTGFLLNGHPSLPFKLYLQSRFDWFGRTDPANRFGRFTYASLEDLAANQPSSFTRTLGSSSATGGEWIGAGAVAGSWTRDGFFLTGGLRVDANRFLSVPATNTDVERLFKIRNEAPNHLDVSPRVGFVWRYRPTTGFLAISTGSALINRGVAQLRGGVGKFRGLLQPALLGDAASMGGWPDGMRQLVCAGAATPAADWTTLTTSESNTPSNCRANTTGLAQSGTSVVAIPGSFSPPESWRANLGWSHSSILKTYLAADVTYSTTTHQPSRIEHNLVGTPQFALADESNRPVFVGRDAVVAGTGALTTASSRRVPGFGMVYERVSDLRADAKQLSVTAIPNLPLGAGIAIASYTFVDARAQSRGFDGTTAGRPWEAEWSPTSLTSRHTVLVQIARSFFSHVGTSLFVRATSGLPFTPVVGGDINGDGASNDRAFVYAPSTIADSAVTAGMRTLLASGSRSARDCLARQLGAIAGRNSCTGPWTASINGNVYFFSIPRAERTRVFIGVTNIGGGVDRLLHGGTGLRGWGTVPLPDPLLLQVRGFDAASSQFRYAVNPRFGATSPSASTRINPFRITLDVQMDLGRTSQEQAVEQNMRIRPSLVGTRAPADTIKARYLRSAGTDIYAQMLRLADSLVLSRRQTEQLQAQQRVLRQRADSIYTDLASFLVALPERFDARDAARRVSATRDSLWKVIYAEREFVVATLTRGQVRLLPSSLREMVMTPSYRGMFFAGGF